LMLQNRAFFTFESDNTSRISAIKSADVVVVRCAALVGAVVSILAPSLLRIVDCGQLEAGRRLTVFIKA